MSLYDTNTLQWLGSAFGMAAAILLIAVSNKIKFVGFVFFCIANSAMFIWGLATDNNGVAMAQGFYLVTGLVTLWTHRNVYRK